MIPVSYLRLLHFVDDTILLMIVFVQLALPKIQPRSQLQSNAGHRTTDHMSYPTTAYETLWVKVHHNEVYVQHTTAGCEHTHAFRLHHDIGTFLNQYLWDLEAKPPLPPRL
jgi:hypothetical protein